MADIKVKVVESKPTKFPLSVSQEIKDACKCLGIQLPKTASICNVSVVGDEKGVKLKYITELGMVKSFIKNRWPGVGGEYVTSVEDFRKAALLPNFWLWDFSDYEFAKMSKQVFLAEGNPGRTLKKIIPDLDDKLVEEFASYFIRGIEFYISDNVTDIYHHSPPKSCMTGKSMAFYEKNGIRIVVGSHRGKVVVRALLWPSIYFTELNKNLPFVDRIFDIDGRFREHLIHFAKSQGFVYRKFNKKAGEFETEDSDGKQTEYRSTFVYKDKVFTDKIQYQIDEYKMKLIPYVDTLVFADKVVGVERYILNNDSGDIKLRQMGGNPLYEETVFSKYYNREIRKKDSVFLLYKRDWVFQDDTYLINEDYFLREDCITCEVCGGHHLETESVNSIEDSSLCSGCAVPITRGKFKGQYTTTANIIEVYNGIAYKEDDFIEVNGVKTLKSDPNLCRGDYWTKESVWVDVEPSYTVICEKNGVKKEATASFGKWVERQTYQHYFDTNTGYLNEDWR